MLGRSAFLAIAVAANLSFSTAASSATYYWRDAGGRAHYSDVCPSGARCVLLGLQGAVRSGVAASSAQMGTSPGSSATAAPSAATSSSGGAAGNVRGGVARTWTG